VQYGVSPGSRRVLRIAALRFEKVTIVVDDRGTVVPPWWRLLTGNPEGDLESASFHISFLSPDLQWRISAIAAAYYKTATTSLRSVYLNAVTRSTN
jgi:hypothetical protein